jgi:hypothetical protein
MRIGKFLTDMPVRIDERKKIWVFIVFYIAIIYITLPVVRPVLKFLYASLGRDMLSVVVNITFILMSAIIVLFSLRKGSLRAFLISIPFMIFIAGTMMIDLPQERVHFLEYGLLGILMVKAVGSTYGNLILSFGFIVVVGSVDEFIQLLLPDRFGDVRDIIMNSLGGGLGLWVGRLWH